MDVDQAGVGSQGCDCRSAPAEEDQTGGLRAGTHCPGSDGDPPHGDDGVSHPASLGMDDRVRELSGSLLDVSGHVGRGAMMRPVGDAKVYLHREPIDMRRGRNGLAALVREAMQQDPFAPEALYVFVGRR